MVQGSCSKFEFGVRCSVFGVLCWMFCVRCSEFGLSAAEPGTPLDVVHLGLGPDGHVCSLFPGHALLGEKTRLVASLDDAPKPPPTRLSLGVATLSAARAVWFIAFGAEKAAAIAAARHPTSTLPAAIVAQRSRETRWFLDAAAADAAT